MASIEIGKGMDWYSSKPEPMKLRVVVLLIGFLASIEALAQGTDILELPSDRVIVFGEMHGIQEIPRFVGDRVEALLKAGRSVRFGLELSSDDTDALNAAMLERDDERLHAMLMTLPQWRNNNDARNGIAMATMLQRMGRLSEDYPGQLTLFAFDIPFELSGVVSPNVRDQYMANRISHQRDRADDDEYVLILVGNAHAFVAPGAPWDAEFRSMVFNLLAAQYPVISLRNAQSGGEAWLCMPDCSIKALTEMGTQEIGIYLEPITMDWSGDLTYHGSFYYGEASASMPLPLWLESKADQNDLN